MVVGLICGSEGLDRSASMVCHVLSVMCLDCTSALSSFPYYKPNIIADAAPAGAGQSWLCRGAGGSPASGGSTRQGGRGGDWVGPGPIPARPGMTWPPLHLPGGSLTWPGPPRPPPPARGVGDPARLQSRCSDYRPLLYFMNTEHRIRGWNQPPAGDQPPHTSTKTWRG